MDPTNILAKTLVKTKMLVLDKMLIKLQSIRLQNESNEVTSIFGATFQCCTSLHKGFVTTFRGGQVLGFVLIGFGILNI